MITGGSGSGYGNSGRRSTACALPGWNRFARTGVRSSAALTVTLLTGERYAVPTTATRAVLPAGGPTTRQRASVTG
ncbi:MULTISPECIES: hypothetical protein [unclassified Methanoculleus]|uniref:hypothetical protein n=1 Tax=unclassified Methanoculleus TaxID=2619537 RepID=UPI0025EE0AF1|nr:MULTISPECIES: hypothetical protein [unclassified Methanoculleus]MCK9317503.1 hypothetical protein [Methanoculleus sp.]MDD2252945.1 hypothetical protein [Methanoculleus sp.]MDD2787976.1 hypothetical protein [Methanoculleus sp.]MDD3215920.1 hypothetical protein [Methanoculleus sp.]MDD4313670.1 hypothetical protein [Methanoculleus sp.]